MFAQPRGGWRVTLPGPSALWLESLPSPELDQLGLEQADHRLRQRIVVADSPD
jgi:hypothetical protein